MFLRQSSLIFNVPGKKYPLFTASEQEFQEIKVPASHRVRRLLTSQHILKCEMTHIASQRLPASGGVHYEPASKVSTSIVINNYIINKN